MPRGRKHKSASMPVIKDIVNGSEAKDIIYDSTKPKAKKGKKPNPVYALQITDDLYISHDARSWTVVQKNNNINKTTGEYYPDKPFLWYSTLAQAIKGLIQYKIKVPDEILDINEKIQKVYDLVDKRIPAGIKVEDLFIDYVGNDDIENTD